MIKSARERMGYNKKQVADMLGISESLYDYLEDHINDIDLFTYLQLAEILHFSIDNII